MTTPVEEQIEALAEKATNRKWEHQKYADGEMDGNWFWLDRIGTPDSTKAIAHVNDEDDAEFIAQIRQLAPEAAKKIRELSARIANDETEMMRQIAHNLRRVVKPEGTEKWWALPIPAFDGKTPQEMIEAGRVAEVLARTLSYLEPSYS